MLVAHHPPVPQHCLTRHPRPRRGGFTLMEMVVAVSLLVIIILSVGVIFQKSSQAVSLSQASMEVFSNVRAVQDQIARDFDGIDRNGFFVIRSQLVAQGHAYDTTNNTTYGLGAHVMYTGQQYESIQPNNKGNAPGPNSAYWVPSNDRADMVAFIANGSFPHRTGTMSATPLADGTVADAALVSYGHGIVQADPNAGFPGTAALGYQDNVSLVDGKPIVTADSPAQTPNGQNATKDLTLCRHATLLMAHYLPPQPPQNTDQVLIDPVKSTYIAAYPDAKLTTAAISAGASDSGKVHITASRIDVAALTPAQLVQSIATNVPSPRNQSRYEADNYCYRFRVLPSPYAANLNGTFNVLNGTYRMHPILLQGAGNFAVDWTDGSSDANGNLKWYGVGNVSGDTTVEATAANGDLYTAIFSFDNKAKWPKAVRIRYRVSDTNDRLNGGREFTQILRVAK